MEDLLEGKQIEACIDEDFVKALLANDLEYMNQIALKTFSSFDVGKEPSEKTEPERFYHGFAFEGKKVLIG